MNNKRVMAETMGFLSRLRRDVRGNTLAFMAALLVPLAALSGSAVDVARMYAVKTRLQQACDAGALAGRKSMTADGTLDTSATGPAQSFFKNNFQNGWFSANSVTFTPTKTAEGQVAGTASAVVPMAVMGMFGAGPRTVNVTCEARYDVADADIVFVLDTTGSMSCLTSDSVSTCNSYAVSSSSVVQNSDGSYSVKEKSGSRIDGLRSAVATFYTTLTSQADPTTHFRFGFVPYAATVNVGGLLDTNYLNQTWSYQTRTPVESNNGTATVTTTTNTSQTACNALAGKTYSTDKSSSTPYTGTSTSVVWTSPSNGTCKKTVQPLKISFHYAQSSTPIDVSGYIASLTTGVGVTNPAMIDGSTSVWAGCIEERYTTPGTANPSTSNPPLDLDVDTTPTNTNSRWAPWWPEVEFWRNNATSEDSATYREYWARSTTAGDTSGRTGNQIGCPKAARRLQTMTATDITNYLSAANGFRPYGYTYHDIGITWGTRLLSPNGIFKADTQAWSGHNPPNRYIVFLTDGDMETSTTVYGAHGMEGFDKRVLGSASTSNLTTYHNNRFAAACTIAKNHNITIFVIAYAQTMTTTLQNCASPGQAYYASDTAALNTAFSAIAKQVAMLRLSK